MARSVVYNSNTFYPVPGSISIAPDNRDAGGGELPNVRNAAGLVLKFKVIPGAVYGTVTNPAVSAILALVPATNVLPDTSDMDTTWEDARGSTGTIYQSVFKATYAGEGAQEVDIEISGNSFDSEA